MQSYKDLLELININENILSNCKENKRMIEMFLLKQGRPAGYREATSYLDADCIRGSRAELHAEDYQKLIEEMEQLDNMIYLQEEILKNLYKTKDEIDHKLINLQGLEYKVYYMKTVKGMTLREIAATLQYSEEHIRRIHSKVH
jgi:DNA-directed RNA polymerase specialized sigma subunit